MQKKLIALAVAGLLSAPAFAQSNVTLYGTLDYGFTSMGNSAWKNHSHDIAGPEYGSPSSRTGLDSGVMKANRIGFKGTEDLGNGLKAVFVLENGLMGDHQPATGGSGIFSGMNRQSYAGLAGGFGTVAFGRQYTPQHLFSAAVDPFGKNGMGGLNNSLIQDTRLDNLFAYISPSFGGFSVVAGYTFNGVGNETVENDGTARVWAIAPSFTWNNLFVAANYHAVKVKNAHEKNLKAWNVLELYGAYDFGFVKVGSLLGRRTVSKDIIGTTSDAKITQFMLGATFKITDNDKVMTSYTRARENSINGSERTRLSQWAIGYEHALSKRTALYALGAFQSWNADASPVFWGGNAGAGSGPRIGGVANNALGYDGAITGVLGTDTSALYRRGFGFGIRHDF